MELTVRAMRSADLPAVLAIYADGIEAGGATLTAEPPTPAAWEAAHLPACRLVAESSGTVAGFVALTPFSSRSVYNGVAELSVYVAARFRGQGVGRALIAALIAESEQSGFWTLLAKVLSGNRASLRLLEACGFRAVGVHEHLGRDRDGRWQDIVLLERRSGLR